MIAADADGRGQQRRRGRRLQKLRKQKQKQQQQQQQEQEQRASAVPDGARRGFRRLDRPLGAFDAEVERCAAAAAAAAAVAVGGTDLGATRTAAVRRFRRERAVREDWDGFWDRTGLRGATAGGGGAWQNCGCEAGRSCSQAGSSRETVAVACHAAAAAAAAAMGPAGMDRRRLLRLQKQQQQLWSALARPPPRGLLTNLREGTTTTTTAAASYDGKKKKKNKNKNKNKPASPDAIAGAQNVATLAGAIRAGAAAVAGLRNLIGDIEAAVVAGGEAALGRLHGELLPRLGAAVGETAAVLREQRAVVARVLDGGRQGETGTGTGTAKTKTTKKIGVRARRWWRSVAAAARRVGGSRLSSSSSSSAAAAAEVAR